MRLSEREKLQALSEARGEPVQEVASRLTPKEIAKLPNSYPKQLHKLIGCDVASTYVDGDLAVAVHSSGLALASEVATDRYVRMYEVLKDKLPTALSGETFLAGLNLAQRFESVSWIPRTIRDNGQCLKTVVEIGAYLGHKAIRCTLDHLVEGGTYHAIELMPENFRILERNISLNALTETIKCHNHAISDIDGDVSVFSKGRQRSGVVPIQNVGEDHRLSMRSMRLETFFRLNQIDEIDFCYVTVNGAELGVLQGCGSSLKRIKHIRIVSKYEVDGVDLGPQCSELLERYGFAVTRHNDTIDGYNLAGCDG